MSTEHQRYSFTLQRTEISAYAALRGLKIVKSYEDAGVSGLSIKNRVGLQALLTDVLRDDCGFTELLVYDVSRWGRFQDTDEAAHYEFLCRQRGISVHYCAELFANDGSTSATILKTLKRAMAAEYSRELSEKVRKVVKGLSAQGYWMGGPAPYGYRRQQVRPDGQLGRVLEPGERNGVKGERIVLVLGPADEVANVRRMFAMFNSGMKYNHIVKAFNREGVPTPRGATKWRAPTLRCLLENEIYKGVYAKGQRIVNLGVTTAVPREQWTRNNGAFAAIISAEDFDRTQRGLAALKAVRSDEAMVSDLRRLLRRYGFVSGDLIDRQKNMCSYASYLRRFGGIKPLFSQIGYEPSAESRRLQRAARLRSKREATQRIARLHRPSSSCAS